MSSPSTTSKHPELVVVLPVYNEEGAIATVLRSWVATLSGLGIGFEIHAYDDGSRDRSPKILGELARAEPRIRVHNHENAGHGPTLLRGYRESGEAGWVFQVDSDDEMGPESFHRLWKRRDEYDFLVGARDGRQQPALRRVVSAVSRISVRFLYGRGLRDVNAPYRLMRGSLLRPWVATIPGDTFAPNVVISGVACRHAVRILELPVPHRARAAGESIRRWPLAKAAVRSLVQLVRYRFGAGAQRLPGRGSRA